MPAMAKLSVIALATIFLLPPLAPKSGLDTESLRAAHSIATDATVGSEERRAALPRQAGETATIAPGIAGSRSSDTPAAISTGLRMTPALQVGDRLKIGFYEAIEPFGSSPTGPDGAADPDGRVRSFYQRMDLSGDYTVEQDGTIAVPILGRFPVGSRTLDDVRADLAASFAAIFGGSAKVDARIVDRAPVSVLGYVRNPGVFRYAPGMIVLQAVALAGGLDRTGESIAAIAEEARAEEHFRVAALKVDQLAARRSLLQAELEAASRLTLAQPEPGRFSLAAGGVDPSSPVDLAWSVRPRREGEDAILRAEQELRRQVGKEGEAKIVAARDEVEALKHKLDQFDVQRALRTERLEAMERLRDRGVETSNVVLILKTEQADIESRRQDSVAAFIEAESRLASAESARAVASLEFSLALRKELAAADRELEEARVAKRSALKLAELLASVGAPIAVTPVYAILRRSGDRAVTLDATETSLIEPGDIVKVASRASDTGSALGRPPAALQRQ